MAILLGNGDGSFQTPVTDSVPIAPYLVLGDFNHDNKPDIALCGGSEISILINNGEGTFKSPTNYAHRALILISIPYLGRKVTSGSVSIGNPGVNRN